MLYEKDYKYVPPLDNEQKNKVKLYSLFILYA